MVSIANPKGLGSGRHEAQTATKLGQSLKERPSITFSSIINQRPL